jgi:hypothetical protein
MPETMHTLRQLHNNLQLALARQRVRPILEEMQQLVREHWALVDLQLMSSVVDVTITQGTLRILLRLRALPVPIGLSRWQVVLQEDTRQILQLRLLLGPRPHTIGSLELRKRKLVFMKTMAMAARLWLEQRLLLLA